MGNRNKTSRKWYSIKSCYLFKRCSRYLSPPYGESPIWLIWYWMATLSIIRLCTWFASFSFSWFLIFLVDSALLFVSSIAPKRGPKSRLGDPVEVSILIRINLANNVWRIVILLSNDLEPHNDQLIDFIVSCSKSISILRCETVLGRRRLSELLRNHCDQRLQCISVVVRCVPWVNLRILIRGSELQYFVFEISLLRLPLQNRNNSNSSVNTVS